MNIWFFALAVSEWVQPNIVQLIGEFQLVDKVCPDSSILEARQNSAVGGQDEQLDIMRSGAVCCVDGFAVRFVQTGCAGIFLMRNVPITTNKIVFEY